MNLTVETKIECCWLTSNGVIQLHCSPISAYEMHIVENKIFIATDD
jgi:hypothetical protein